MVETHLAFSLRRRAVQGRILIPKYYDPDLRLAEERATEEYTLVELGELLYPGEQGSRLGTWIRREFYGTGSVPYVRTSDIAHWRIRADYKKGVAEAVYNEFRASQDVLPGDVLFVAHGTYLVGNVALVTQADAKLLVQDHIFRLRVNPSAGVDAYYLLAALSTAFVRRQVRSRQFSADIIDKVGERHLGIKIPIPRNRQVLVEVAHAVKDILDAQTSVRDQVGKSLLVQTRMTRERADSRLGFQVPRSLIRNRILIPKYYDPGTEDEVQRAAEGENWSPLETYVASGSISVETGVEVGKMAYGTGPIPFIRTSDIADLELRRDIRHGVSKAIYGRFESKASVRSGDVLVVRDGTYLVGSSAMVTVEDVPALFCGGLYRLRCEDPERFSSSALLVALNLPSVRRQMRAKQFTRDVIDTLGNRLFEVRIPPIDSERWRSLGLRMEGIVRRKANITHDIEGVIERIEPAAPPVLAGRPSWSMR